ALERNLLHHVADTLDYTTLHEVLCMERVDDLTADVSRHPHLVDLHALLVVDCDLRDFSEVSPVTVLERHAETSALRSLPGPLRLFGNQLQHGRHARRVEAVTAALRCRIRL